ncbi:MAG: hypothetical protein WCK21_05705 [Actinomycetota bacterium]
MRNRSSLSLFAVVAFSFVASCSSAGSSPSSSRRAADQATTTAARASGDELPAPDKSSFVGVNQVVNLAVLPDGTTPALDIWALRTFQHGPVLLAEGLKYGEVSKKFGTPPNAVVASVLAGKGPDAKPFSGMFKADAEQHYTSVIMYDRDSKVGTGVLLEDVDPGISSSFPDAQPGKALVQLWAYQLTLHPLAVGSGFSLSLGGHDVDFQVGIKGTTGCAPQPRQTDKGLSPMVLGGTQRVPFDVAPGSSTFTFHGWGTYNKACADPTIITPVTVTLKAGERVWVMLHSRDGQTVESLVVPVA